jgi:hypothetical protein
MLLIPNAFKLYNILTRDRLFNRTDPRFIVTSLVVYIGLLYTFHSVVGMLGKLNAVVVQNN